MKDISSLYKSPYFAVFVDIYELVKKHKKKMLILCIVLFDAVKILIVHLDEMATDFQNIFKFITGTFIK